MSLARAKQRVFGTGVTCNAASFSILPAAVTELADVQDLGSCAFGREGSSPSGRILIFFR